MIETDTFGNNTDNEAIENASYEVVDGSPDDTGRGDTPGYKPYDSEEERSNIVKRQRVKTNLFTTGTTIVFNSLPIVVDKIKHRKDTVPYKINKLQLGRLLISSCIPLLKTVDDFALKGKIQEKIPLSDIGNVVNIVAAYPATHKTINNFVTNLSREKSNKPKLPIDKSVTMAAWTGTANIIAPYIVNKLTDNNLSFGEKINSVIPIPIAGRFIKQFMTRNPELARAYDVGTNVVRAANGINRSVGGAVRPSSGSIVNKTIDTTSSVLDTVSGLLGMGKNSNGYGRNGGGYTQGGYNSFDSYGYNKSRW